MKFTRSKKNNNNNNSYQNSCTKLEKYTYIIAEDGAECDREGR